MALQANPPYRCHDWLIRTMAIIVLACLCPVHGFAVSSAKNLRQYVLRSWTSEQGLPQNSIRAMLQTRDGFLWIGTRGGLARFDGAAFVLYKAGAANTIPNDSITGLAEDRDGSLWVSSAGGLTRYSHGRFHNYSSKDGLAGDSIWRITADPAGGVWAVTRRTELFHFDGTTVHQYMSPIAPRPEEVNALLEDKQGTLWVATFHGLFAFDRNQRFRRFTRADGLAGDRVYALAFDCQHQIWAGGEGGLTHRSSGRFVPIRVRGLPTATLLAFDTDGRDQAVWTGATGLGLFRLKAGGVQRLQAAQGLISDELWLLYFTREGSLWLGAINGLNQLSDGDVTSYSVDEGVPTSTLGIQRSQGPDGQLWFGLRNFQVHVRDGKLVPISPRESAKRSNHETSPDLVHRLDAISIWARSNDTSRFGLVLTDASDRQSIMSDGVHSSALPAIPWASIGTMLIDRSGTIWVGGSQIGTIAYGPNAPPRSFTTANGLDDNNVGSLAEDASGNIWVGTLSGLNRIRHGIVTHVVSCANVTSIDASAADGSIWGSSDSGLIYVPPTLAPARVFTSRETQPANVIEGVAADAQGYLWLGTQQGIVRIKKNDLLASSNSHPQGTSLEFGVGDGFRNAQLRENSVFRSRNGNIWFMTLDELAMIDPRKISARPLASIIMDGADIDERPESLIPAASLTIPAGRHRLSIRFTLAEFRIPSRIHFRYRLDGWDKKWIQAGVPREATYTGIPPGHYTFRVSHSDGYGNWGSAESTLSIRVTPYFYQTSWFFTLMALLVVACIWQLHRFRVTQVSGRINARMQERTRIARELHDTLLQGIIGISLQMYAASQQAADAGSVPSVLGHASQRLREIAEQSRKAVEDLRSPPGTPDPLEAMLALALRDMDLPASIQSQISSVGSRIDLRPPVLIEVEQIVREAVANAVRHSGTNIIRIDILYQPAHFFLSVSDNGCGMDQQIQVSGRIGHWGVTGMRERAESVGAQLRILPHIPHGTVVEISLRGTLAYAGFSGWRSASIFRRLSRR